MIIVGLPKKVLEKNRKELLELHQRCCKTYLIQKGLKYQIRNKFFKLYLMTVSEKNILEYFPIPINLFCQALVKDTLGTFFKYGDPQYVRKNRKKSIHRKK